ncbi:bifunctional diguanylate cyclase/phosphodiesterase [Pseudomonas matsuisoli]|uniref:Bifunctional diguanylate cyclase/phosphodiesterase n=1 Tax=Pseudomonas matsuisoli TaxID=1515666 RepID=A0A917Q3E4_9PSED|nr:EAL domain-containing protein [Pseudomonas matsuisoli]GGK10748.1 bifunctional diguanylate cyclase/phosphodiesterase [Pseudomonas matsuisoli]
MLPHDSHANPAATRPIHFTLTTAAREASLGFIALIVLVFALACAALVYLCAELDERQDLHSRADAVKAVEFKQDKVGTALVDYAFWKDAYDHTHGAIDSEWLYDRNNIGSSLYSKYGVDGVFIVGPDLKTHYSVVEGKLSEEAARQWLPPRLDQLLAIARAKSKEDGYAQSYFLIKGQPAIVSAAVMRPDSSYENFADLSYLLYVDVLRDSELAAMGNAFDLQALGAQGDIHGRLVGPSIVLQSSPGDPIVLQWENEDYGRTLLDRFLPMLITLGFAAGAIIWYLQRKIAEAANLIDDTGQALRNSEQRFRNVTEASSDWIWETDIQQRLVYLSDRFTEVTGFDRQHWLGKPLYELLGYEPSALETAAREVDRGALARTLVSCEMLDPFGMRKHCQLSAKAIMQGDRLTGFQGAVCDVTEAFDAKARVEHISQHDALTGLANRHNLSLYLSQRFNEGVFAEKPIYLITLDLERFKPVNDSLGYAAGDLVLREVARVLKNCTRDVDLVARTGGDEFAIVTSGCVTRSQAQGLCDRLLERLDQTITFGDQEINIGASIGVATAPGDGTTADDLLRYADIALYEAKAAGRSICQFYERTMNERILERRRVESDLRQALKRHEFKLEFQPRFDAQPQRLAGAEALVRWQHPTRGLLSPGYFIQTAEETGLIFELSDWVLREACIQAVGWEDHLIVSVNLSPVEFQRDDLVDRIRVAIQHSGISAERLELEITESVLLDDANSALETMLALKALGVRLSMDDFGTGYSSLSYLRTYPFDCLKIDRSFVSDIDAHGNQAIVEAIISMGNALSLMVVAEGVETREQLEKLAAMHCHQAQGYYLGRPMSSERFRELRLEAADTVNLASLS